MSIENTTSRSKTVSTGSIDVTSHARLRWLQRIDASCPNPAEQIRQIVADGRTIELTNFDNPAQLLDGIAVVVDDTAGEAITVLSPSTGQIVGDRQSGNNRQAAESEQDASAGWREEYAYQGVHPGGHR